jgi:hypothetical protein
MRTISPTPGRIVWVFGCSDDPQPFAAIVTYVHNDHLINVAAFEASGHHRPLEKVPLWQPGEGNADGGVHAEWMPYQIGQAAKAELDEAPTGQLQGLKAVGLAGDPESAQQLAGPGAPDTSTQTEPQPAAG